MPVVGWDLRYSGGEGGWTIKWLTKLWTRPEDTSLHTI